MARLYKVDNACEHVFYMHTGYLQANTWLIADGETVMVVDPAGEVDSIVEAVDGASISAIILTHWHADHVAAAKELRERTGALVVASPADAARISGELPLMEGHHPFENCPVDHRVDHGDILEIGTMPWKVIHTPGHTKGSICLYLDSQFGINPEGLPLLISGDTLFYGTIGRTDFEDGSMDDMRESLRRLAVLPDNTIVLPGHNYYTTIGAERERVFAFFAK